MMTMALELNDKFYKNHCNASAVDIYYSNNTNIYIVELSVSGDWKHDHLRADWLVDDYFYEKGYTSVNHAEEEIESDGSDWYESTHYCYYTKA